MFLHDDPFNVCCKRGDNNNNRPRRKARSNLPQRRARCERLMIRKSHAALPRLIKVSREARGKSLKRSSSRIPSRGFRGQSNVRHKRQLISRRSNRASGFELIAFPLTRKKTIYRKAPRKRRSSRHCRDDRVRSIGASRKMNHREFTQTKSEVRRF